MRMTHRSIAYHTLLLSLLHLLVDGLCACGLMLMSHRIVSDMEAYSMIVLYDVLAFGTQPLTGRGVDGSDTSPGGLKMAVMLLAGGALVSWLPISPTVLAAIAGAVLLGMGNSLFHVYGGRYVAVASHNDIRAMGVFVSTGAVGLAIGLGFSNSLLMAVFFLTLMALTALHLLNADVHRVTDGKGLPIPVHPEAGAAPARSLTAVPLLYLSCLMLVVAGRACIGESVPSLRASFPLIGAPLTMVVVSVIVMVGKAAGGFLSKRWGVRKVFIASMLLSAVTFLMCPWHDIFVLATLLLINISMPCTLYLATKASPGREGWVFGLLAMALLPGYLLGYLSKGNAICQTLLIPLMATILLESLLLLWMRERRWQVLAVSVVLNILTNIPLNALIIAYGVTSPLTVLGLECLVVAVEFLGFWLVLREPGRAFKYSFLCNAFSALVGCLCQLLFT